MTRDSLHTLNLKLLLRLHSHDIVIATSMDDGASSKVEAVMNLFKLLCIVAAAALHICIL